MNDDLNDARTPLTWEMVLDSLERELDVSAALLEGLGDQQSTQSEPLWESPIDLGPMPQALVLRARSISRRQELALHHLHIAITLAQQRQAYVEHMSSTAQPNRAAFIDRKA